MKRKLKNWVVELLKALVIVGVLLITGVSNDESTMTMWLSLTIVGWALIMFSAYFLIEYAR